MNSRYFWPWVLCLLALAPLESFAVEKVSLINGRETYEWSPAVPRYQKTPIVIFSHGLKGCAANYRVFMERLAVQGIAIFAPNHADATCHSDWPPRPEGKQATPEMQAEDTPRMKRANQWDAATYANRKDDLIAVLDALRKDPMRKDTLDFSRIALMGQELGGYTVLGMMGVRPEWSTGWDNSGIRAVLAVTPYARPYNQMEQSWEGLKVPVMLQSGSGDGNRYSLADAEKGGYGRIKAPKYFVAFRRTGNSDWQNLGGEEKDSIVYYTNAFLQYHLTGEYSPILTQSGSSLILFGYESELGAKALTSPKSLQGKKTPYDSTLPTAAN